MSVPVTLGADVTVGRPRKLFEWGPGWDALLRALSRTVHAGSPPCRSGMRRILSSLSLVQNWHAEFVGR